MTLNYAVGLLERKQKQAKLADELEYVQALELALILIRTAAETAESFAFKERHRPSGP
ncbi:hypothetical protein ES708_35015 [subsurface metagenome]